MTATNSPAHVCEPAVGWDGWQRKAMATGMASEIVSLFDQLSGALSELLDGEALEQVDSLVMSMRDRSMDIVESMKGQVRW